MTIMPSYFYFLHLSLSPSPCLTSSSVQHMPGGCALAAGGQHASGQARTRLGRALPAEPRAACFVLPSVLGACVIGFMYVLMPDVLTSFLRKMS